MKCSKCLREIPDGSEFCSYCGSKQEEKLFCRKCGRELPPDSDFCQFCGTDISQTDNSPHFSAKDQKSNGKSKKKITTAIIIAVVILALVAGVIICLKSGLITINGTTNNEKEDKSFDEMSVEEKMAASQYISLSEYKENENYKALGNQNLHFSGYVVQDNYWDTSQGITIAESQEWPYDYVDLTEYAASKEGDEFIMEKMRKWEDEYNSIKKTTTVYVKLDQEGQVLKRPLVGDYVDVFFVGNNSISPLAYCIVVR